MSCEIFCDRRSFKIAENQYLVMFSIAQSNVTEYINGKEVRARDWTPLMHNDNPILTKEDIESILDEYYANSELYKTRYTTFNNEKQEFKKWVLNSLKRAISIEEAVSYGASNALSMYFIDKEIGFTGEKRIIESNEMLRKAVTEAMEQGKNYHLIINGREFVTKPRKK